MKPYYLTTAIDYTNAPPHIGHAYEKILADVMVRFQRLAGREAYFLTGADQHGQKVQKSAEKAGVSPAQFVDDITAKFIALWDKLNVRYDHYAQTIDPKHKKVVQAMLQKLHDCGQLYKQSYKGFYSVRQEQFLTDKDRGPDGNFGTEWWGEVVETEEENWYFRLSEHVEWLSSYIKSHPDFIFPAFRANDVLNALESGQDLCISRPIERLSWGIPLPFDERFVNYVWFDALTNYISFAGYLADEVGNEGMPDFAKLWPADAHVIGKDILVPAHAIYWPIMLHALGFSDEQIPRLIVHGWWNIKGEKMSKSLGNVVDPAALAGIFSVDGLRYYLMKDMATGYDADLSEERMEIAYNKELAGGLGNLLNRTLKMLQNASKGVITASSYDDEVNQTFRRVVADAPARYAEKMNAWAIHEGIAEAWKIVDHANFFIDHTQPFKMKDPALAERRDSVLHHLAESLVHVSVLLSPVMPEACAKIREQLGWHLPEGFTVGDLKWGLLPVGHQLNPPVPVFPRVELGAEKK
ncbi:methionyl-tRNA synthetase [Roseimicrobium gellanilyticum]|uniref:methionine--tRNA ligase n=1 Tax=Roseimicrobium gellanilyticum TaxID=748857 RepID=A0A366HU84_9BACT|nr:class I tRNA ligase family protein [Roseimicrobium gellanilyticum]RBP47400.1 methionyl-tRNA synthetase [Roseimicrobium gellanilyticum]